MGDPALKLPGRRSNKGFADGGFRGLIAVLFIFLLFIIFLLTFIIVMKEEQHINTNCAYLNGNETSKSLITPATSAPVGPIKATSQGATQAPNTGFVEVKTTGSVNEKVNMSTQTTGSVNVMVNMSTPTTIESQQQPTMQAVVAEENDMVCDSVGCVIKAGRILEYVGDGLFDKCKEFVPYACAGWQEDNPIPDHASEYNVMKKAENEVALILKRILERSGNSDDADIRRASAFYHSCMNRSAIEEYGLAGIQQLIGAWPILQPAWVGGNMFQYDLTDSIETSVVRGYPVFFDLYVGPSPRNVSSPMLLLEEPQLGMKNKAYYLDPAFQYKLKSYGDLALKAAVLLGADQRRAANEVIDMIAFEIELARILETKPKMKGFPYDYREMTVADLDVLTTEIAWTRLLDQTVTGITNSDLRIGVLNYNFVSQLANLLNNTPVRTLGNYITWKFVLHNMDHLPQDFQTINWWYEMALHDAPSVPARWRKCLQQTIHNFPHTSEKIYYSSGKSNFNFQSISMVRNIFENTRSILIERLILNQWMTAADRQSALDKISAMDIYFLNGTSTKMEYTNINVTSEPFLYNLLRIRPQKTAVHLRLGPNAQPRASWEETPLSLGVYYDYKINGIIVPAVAFHLPYFTISTRGINFATVGVIISREMIKAIDKMGSNFDYMGNYAPWWSTVTADSYDQRLRCLGNRFDKINVTQVNMMVDMDATFDDITKENMAIEMAFQASQRWSSSQNDESRYLPSIEIKPEELFFLSYTQMKCAEVRKEKYLEYVVSASSVPEPYRTNATLSQNSAFSETLRCSKQTPRRINDNCALF